VADSRKRGLDSRFDPHVPNVARMYDYALGGKDNYAADREAVAEVIKFAPNVPYMARENRRFLQRAVRHLVTDYGVSQFLDIGAGLPTQGNVHEAAGRLDPEARVVYVDIDPIVLTHARALLPETEEVDIIEGDLRRPAEILRDAARIIDFDRPVAVLTIAILHFISDADDPWRHIRQLRDALAPGSYLALSHITDDDQPEESVEEAVRVYDRASAPFTPRGRADVMRFFDGFDLVEPGLTTLSRWRPDRAGEPAPPDDTNPQWCYAGVGRLRP
jgi:SAM-dependent methyltransferase